MENYNADSIKILSDIDHIRLRSGMYIGDNSNTIPLFNEAIDNSVDEVTSGYSDSLLINCVVDDEKATYTIKDTGRGIPTGVKEVNGQEMPILEAIITKANSGGKFDSSAYLSSAGLNGVGLCCINALADKMTLRSVNNGVVGEIKTENGVVVTPVEYKKIKEKSGTIISFTVLKENKYFDDYVVPYEYIVHKLNTYQAFGIKNIKFIYNGEDLTEKEITATSPFDLHKHPMDNGKNALVCDISVEAENKERFRIAFNYIDSASTSYKFNGYTNYLYNKDGGGHILAAQEAIIEAFKIFCDKRNITMPSNMNSDYFIGINCIVACNIIEKAFSSQTKDKLITGTGTTRDYFKGLVKLVAEEINRQCFEKNVGITKALIQRISDYRKERENKKELKGLSQYITINQSEGNTVRRGVNYDKLVECSSKNKNETELMILEGDSASSGCIRNRNKATQAILSLKGKLKNIVGCTMTDALKNKEIAGIISVVGTGIFDKCDIKRIRYNEILYVGDSDSDGYQIQNLVISFFVNYMPEVVKAGKLKLVISPLYIYKNKDNEWQGADTINEMPKNVINKHEYIRIKGIGEYNPDQLKVFVLDKNKRKTITVKYPSNLEEFNDIMGTSTGKRSLLMETGLLEE